MTINQKLHNKEEHVSEKSDNVSIESENPARIEDIFEWIDGLPLSKTTKNLARDFSDAVLMSEILKFYYPYLVKKHNYIPACGVTLKKENWNTLNRKVLTKIDLPLNPETIDQLAHSQVGVIDKVLLDFRDKQMAKKLKEITFNQDGYYKSESKSSKERTAEAKETLRNQSFFYVLFGILCSILCFWKWFLKKPIGQPNTLSEDINNKATEEVSEKEKKLQELYTQAVKDVRYKSDLIKTLCEKVNVLESSTRLKNMKIARLTQLVEQNSVENLMNKGTCSANNTRIRNKLRNP